MVIMKNLKVMFKMFFMSVLMVITISAVNYISVDNFISDEINCLSYPDLDTRETNY